MQKLNKRFFSLLLALALLWTLAPQIAWSSHAADPTSGVCGENLTWSFDPGTGTLTVAGSGDMEGDSLWIDYRDSIQTVILPAGLTSICDDAFSCCTALTSLTIPDAVTCIGSWAFADCAALASLTLPAELTEIGYQAFENCIALTEITFPDALTAIGEYAFSNCAGLTSIPFPDGLTSIAWGAFRECAALTEVTLPVGLTELEADVFSDCTALTAIFVAEGNPCFSSDAEGVVFDREQTTLLLYPCGKTGSYAVPDSVSVIGVDAFCGCEALTEITFPAGLTDICEGAFCDCTGLTSLSFPAELAAIDAWAFSGCIGLTSVPLPAGLTSIDPLAFTGCPALTAFSVAADNPSFRAESGVVFDKEKTALILYPCGRTGAYAVPSGVTSIAEFAFYD